MYDGVVTVTDVSTRQHRGEFAYLSSCKTAVGGINLLDEVTTFAAALSYAGYRHVIATLWSVGDRQAAQIAEEVYARLVSGGHLNADNAAEALHHAVRALRDEHPERPAIWTPLVHTGP